MNRLATILALVAALALSTAVGASAAPGGDGLPTADAAAAKAKKKAAKRRAAKRRAANCKAKKGKPKKRAKARKRANRKATGRDRRATAGSSQAKRRGARRKVGRKKAGRKKAGRCKAGKRRKGKRAPRTKRDRKPSAGLAVGHYADGARSLTAVNEGGGSAKLAFVIPEKPVCPALGALIGLEGTLTETGKGARIVAEGGSFLAVRAVMTIESDLRYRLDITYTVQFPDAEPCRNGATISGKLAKS